MKKYYYEFIDGKKKKTYKEPKIGDTRKDTNGYVVVWTGSKFESEHRFVIEQYLGRKLITGEVVHHRNGKRDDNRLENLQLLADVKHCNAIETKHSEDIHRLMLRIKELVC